MATNNMLLKGNKCEKEEKEGTESRATTEKSMHGTQRNGHCRQQCIEHARTTPLSALRGTLGTSRRPLRTRGRLCRACQARHSRLRERCAGMNRRSMDIGHQHGTQQSALAKGEKKCRHE